MFVTVKWHLVPAENEKPATLMSGTLLFLINKEGGEITHLIAFELSESWYFDNLEMDPKWN